MKASCAILLSGKLVLWADSGVAIDRRSEGAIAVDNPSISHGDPANLAEIFPDVSNPPALEAETSIHPADRAYAEGEALLSASEYEEALVAFQQALTLYETASDRPGMAATLMQISQIDSNLGQYQAALEATQRALEIFQDLGDRPGMAEALTLLGSHYSSLGQYAEALQVLEESLTWRRELGDRAGEANTLTGMMFVYRSLGDFEQALAMTQQALQIRQALGDRAAVGGSLTSIGVNYTSLGQYSEALAAFQQALAVRREIGDLPGVANTLTNMHFLYRTLGRFEDALTASLEVLAIRRELGDLRGQGATLTSVGANYTDLGRYDEALASFQEALSIRTQLGDVQGQSNTWFNIALTYESLEQYALALEAYDQALRLRQVTGDRPREALTYSAMGTLLAEQDQPELAIVFFKQAVNITEAIRQGLQELSLDLQQSYLATVTDTYRQLADLLLQQDRVLEAQHVLDLLKVRELDQYFNGVRGDAQTAQGIDFWQAEQRITELFSQSEQNEQSEILPELSGDRPNADPQNSNQGGSTELITPPDTASPTSFNEFLENPETQRLVEQLRRTAQGQNLNPEILIGLQNQLQSLHHAVLLYPFVLEDRLELILITPDRPPIRRTVAVGRTELNNAIQQFRSQLTNRTENPRPQAQRLYQWLIQPIEADLLAAEAETIIYATDGQLRYIPLAALHDGDRWLIQRFAINYITAASLTDFSDRQPDSASLHILAAAFSDINATYDIEVGGKSFRFYGLEYAGLEVENIATEIPDTTLLLNQNFSRSGLEAQMENYNIVHLATHAEFVSGTPEDSFILFGNGEYITLRDIANWSLPEVELVVLSACRTAIGGALGSGEEILGFGYQIQRTGARAAIASLWAIDDVGSQVLMTEFYAALANGVSEADALRQAQIALINNTITTGTPNPNFSFAHPYYWSPFILIGNGL